MFKNFNLELENEVLVRAYNKGGKFARDYTKIREQFERLLSGDSVDYMSVIKVLADGISYHNSGKIEGIQSLDSSAHCDFCKRMREMAKNDDSIICGYCYDYAQETSYRGANVLPRHWLNMKILSLFELPTELLKFLPIYTPIFRFNSSGDIVNRTHAINLINIVVAFPHINFGLWSKNQFVVDSVFDEIGKPDNVRFIQSVYKINGTAKKSRYADTLFVVCDDDHINEFIANGGNVCNGRKCLNCGYACYLKESDGGHAYGTTTVERLRKV